MKPLVQLLWFKKDLRISDHQPLWEAAKSQLPTLAVFLFEPQLMAAPDSSFIHWRFAAQGLPELKAQLNAIGIPLVVKVEECVDFLNNLLQYVDIAKVYSHVETGNALSFERDKKLTLFLQQKGIPWLEFQRDGIQRRLSSRKEWPAAWYKRMHEPLYASPRCCFPEFPLKLPFFDCFELPEFPKDQHLVFQPGGRKNGLRYLNSFLNERSFMYVKHISKPALSRKSCSRLSPYLAWGMLSMREVYQASLNQRKQKPELSFQLKFFEERLRWHCHFIQKFETECRMEFRNMNPAYNQVRIEVDEKLVQAWKDGMTGFPLVDACMRCLKATGYINFRMRAMLVSFLTHNCWQPWQAIAPYLAQLFLDYEPGIHYPQIQMQAGTVGTHIIRTYDVVKQSYQQDPMGIFIKQWVPELSELSLPYVHEPWKLSQLERKRLIPLYPEPVVDLRQSRKHAQDELWALKKSKEARQHSKRLLELLSNTKGS